MNAYTKLKEDYDHLQKRTWQLFEIGFKREGTLEGVLTNAWHEIGRISELDDITAIKERLLAVRMFIGDTFADNNQIQSDNRSHANYKYPCPECGKKHLTKDWADSCCR